MRYFVYSLIAASLLFAPACQADNQFKNRLPIQKIEVSKYLGTWYEIARVPNWFEKELVGVTATYSLKNNGNIEVKNSGYQKTLTGEKKTAIGNAWIPDPAKPGALQVSFFWPFSAGYNVVAIAPDYSYALVFGDTTEYAWILSRTPTMDVQVYNNLIKTAESLGIPSSTFEKVPQR